MLPKHTARLLLLAALAFFSTTLFAQDANEARKFQSFLARAEKGDDKAQLAVALRYERGMGVAKDFDQAMAWYLRAASQGNAGAQGNLGVRCQKTSKYKDMAESYKWLSLAAAQGHKGSIRQLAALEKKISDADRAEGKKRAGAFKPKKEAAGQ
ncbi:SEL1-like repeat protein [Termitidicoccus mucosus]|uniref:Sel1 repeat family protein n=1 Tax=Termitidicoccus mucosus TaxID=1184151 RepID=A0A178IGN1_9BACT|nr:hypothetical protein AW736_14560 [Opitutaceae bacterium TSB47]